MKKKLVSIGLITIVMLLSILQVTGCKDNKDATGVADEKDATQMIEDRIELDEELDEEEKEQLEAVYKEIAENSEIVNNDITADQGNDSEGKDFASISNFIDLIDDATNKLDDASGEVDSFEVMGDMLFMYQLGMMINDAGLEQALNGSQDTYVSEIKEAPNGTGTYTSSITLDNGSYFFGYDFTYNDGSSYYVKLSYVPADKTVSAERSHTDGSIAQANYLATDEALFVSYGDSSKDFGKTNQMLVCQVGDNVYYATKMTDDYNSEPLPVDIFGVSPTDWNSFVANFDYQRMLQVEDGKVEFTEN